jgi:hypothetical protein
MVRSKERLPSEMGALPWLKAPDERSMTNVNGIGAFMDGSCQDLGGIVDQLPSVIRGQSPGVARDPLAHIDDYHMTE